MSSIERRIMRVHVVNAVEELLLQESYLFLASKS